MFVSIKNVPIFTLLTTNNENKKSSKWQTSQYHLTHQTIGM